MGSRRTTRERELDREIAELAVVVEQVSTDSARISGMRQLGQLRAERARIRDVRLAQASRDPLKRISKLRTIAEREGSWVAASSYQRTEADLRARLAEAEAARVSEELTELSPADLLSIVGAAVETIPREYVVQIAELVADRLSPVQLAHMPDPAVA